MKRQPVITGLGIVSPIGVGVEKFWAAARAGKSGIRAPTLFDASKLPPECRIVGEVLDFNPHDWMPRQTARVAGRFSQFAIAAAKMAFEESRLESSDIEPERFAVSFGTSMSGLVDVEHSNFLSFLRGEEMRPWTVLEYPGHAATSHVAISVGARGQTGSIATACASGLDVVKHAADIITQGKASVALAGATEAPLSAASLEAFRALGALSTWPGPPAEASRPFDKLRSGLVLAEGSAAVMVEDEASARARHAPIYARILGTGAFSESQHMRNLDATGEPAARAIQLALRDAHLAPEDIDYVCAHGNSLIDYDASETAGIKLAFGKRAWCLPISSIKSMCGQALAASGTIQIVTSCLAIRDHIAPPTINYEFRDPLCDLDYVPNTSRAVRMRAILIHAQSIGGSHVAMILGKPC